MSVNESTRFTCFVDAQDKELLEQVTGRPICELVEDFIKREAREKWKKVLNRCMQCNEEVILFVKAKRTKHLMIMRRQAVVCKVCDPKSRWRRVKDVK